MFVAEVMDGLDLISRGESSVVCALICTRNMMCFPQSCMCRTQNEQIGCIDMCANRFSVKKTS